MKESISLTPVQKKIQKRLDVLIELLSLTLEKNVAFYRYRDIDKRFRKYCVYLVTLVLFHLFFVKCILLI